ncbi:MAG: drug/metabolite transporter (DMT)-like permease [Halioglobus sp.]|jgi:drug/metabolite transporter (DMT)-like permease
MKVAIPEKLKTHLALTTVAFLYGLNYLIAKDVMVKEYLTPFGFIMLRVIAGFIIFSAIHSIFIKEKLDKKDLLYTVMCAVFGVMVNMLAFFEGLKHTSPIHASLIMVLTPCIVLLISALIIKEKVTKGKILGIILGLIGAALLVSNSGNASDKEATIYGDLLVMVNAISYGLYLVLVRRLYIRYKPITVLKWMFLFGVILVIPFGGYDAFSADYSSFPINIWFSVFYVLVLVTAGAYLLNAYALSRAMPSTVGFYMYFQPLIAAAAAILVGDDTIDFVKICSALLLFTGVYFVNKRSKR